GRQAREDGQDSIVGFALGTDDAVETLFHVFATRTWVTERQAEDPEIGLVFVEWEQSADDGLFREAGQALRALAAGDGSLAAAEARFKVLADALRTARREGQFDDDTLLYVGSTDPDETAEAWARDATRDLNSTKTFQALCNAMGWEA
ncbi:MAG: hypothetical protein K0R83_1248, partial [Caulobacter sp.]|nr:hypothetical protein [Caulobacter sp.]